MVKNRKIWGEFMPFDFKNLRHYSIDYGKLFEEFNSHRFVNDKHIQIEYLKAWFKVLMDADKVITEQLKTKESIIQLSQLLRSEPEIFKIPMYHKSNTIFIQFRATIANEIIPEEDKKNKYEFIDINEFVKKNSKICWNPVKENVDSYAEAKDPILMVPFLSGTYTKLVIDGNHRLTYKVKNNVNDIHALLISERTVIEQSLFSGTFDKLYYIMHNELNYMKIETDTKNTNAMELMNKSYLVDGKFKFKEYNV
ncbi:hypothetical protein [Clostridium sp. VAP51]|uniref:hypothetical protein n=1 Tax=Clostridium sp. VAP51 TaxID=2949978 RepID=UPI0020794530|nr:hypothetical protein [Clostridium sp. VAP51]